MRPDAERERLRQTFDQAADSYDRVRPDYPDELFDDLVALTGVTPGDHLLEVGCATGKATRPLARRGFRITCIELGAGLAATARVNLAGFPVEVIQGAFEQWQPTEPASLVYAATAWHWIDPAVRYQRAWRALRPGGHLAIWGAGHVFTDGGDPFFLEIQDVYDEIGDIELLNTFSGHLSMADWKRQRLYTEIRRRLALRPDHSVRRHWGAALQVARRRDEVGAASGPAGAGPGSD